MCGLMSSLRSSGSRSMLTVVEPAGVVPCRPPYDTPFWYGMFVPIVRCVSWLSTAMMLGSDITFELVFVAIAVISAPYDGIVVPMIVVVAVDSTPPTRPVELVSDLTSSDDTPLLPCCHPPSSTLEPLPGRKP